MDEYKYSFKTERIYYVSQFDNRAHCLYDREHQIINEKYAYIGKYSSVDGFRIDEEVNLFTMKEISEFFK